MAENILSTQIMQLILNWKLEEATDLLEANQSELSVKDIFELRGLNERYQGYLDNFHEAESIVEEDPDAAQYAVDQIPEDIRITYPGYESLLAKLNTVRDVIARKQAFERVDEAYNAIVIEFNSAKAAEALETAKQIYPDWDRVPELREKILKTSELQEKLERGLYLQTEVSALREKGGIASYQKAMSLINEYSSLGLESYGIALFDADHDREDLLKMITRAEGESWKNRLRPDGIPAETLRLEQSIRSLEDAESKNLRVLYNNNARLMILLTSELQQEPPDSERAIQINSRINELREKNQKIQTDIHDEVAKRANSYCRLAEKALDAGELSSAEINIRLAKETGKPAAEYDEGDYLGEVSLPTETLDKILSLEERYADALSVRNEIAEKYRIIRDEYNADDNITLNKLLSWVNQIDDYFARDSHTPGLAQFRDELHKRYDSVKSYVFEKGLAEIDRAINKGDPAAAKEKLDQLNSLNLDTDEKRTLRNRQTSINQLEDANNQVENLLKKADEILQNALNPISSDRDSVREYEDIFREIESVYSQNAVKEPQSLIERKESGIRQLQLIESKRTDFESLKAAMDHGLITIESLKTAESFENSESIELKPVKKILAEFWFFCAKSDNNQSNIPHYLAKAEKFAEDSGDANLFEAVSQFRVDFNNKYIEGQRVNFILNSLHNFQNDKAYTAGVDYIAKNITAEDRKNPQIQQAADRLEQLCRISQSEFYLRNAKDAFADGNYQDAEEAITKSLDFFYTLEAAQFQKMIISRQQADRALLEEIDDFLSGDIGESGKLTEEQAEEIRYLSEKINQSGKRQIADKKTWAKIAAAQNRIERIINQEKVDFNDLQIQFNNSLILGPQGLNRAADILKQMESRVWVENRSQQILELKLRLDEINNAFRALSGMIEQANSFVRQGDFRSAERILNSFQTGEQDKWPDWLKIQKENAENEIRDLSEKYHLIQSRFTKDSSGNGEVIEKVNRILDPKTSDPALISELSNELNQYKTILEKEIKVDPEKNPYIKQINYLLGLLNWVESSDNTIRGYGIRGSEISLDAIYAIRKNARDFFEQIPAELIGIQPGFAARNKWLEQRTQAHQLLTQLNESPKKSRQKRSERGQTIKNTIRELERMDLLPREAESLQRNKDTRKKKASRKHRLVGGLISIILILGALYMASPKLIPLLTPSPTLSLTPTLSETPTLTLTNTVTPSPTLTATPTLTMTPTATFTFTPTPVGLTGLINNNRVGVYELPSGMSVMISDGYLEPGTKVNVIRYCEPDFNKGEIWALIFYPSKNRNTGWIRVRLPDSPDFVSLSDINMPAIEVIRANPYLKIECPTLPYQRMPGDEITLTPAVTQTPEEKISTEKP